MIDFSDRRAAHDYLSVVGAVLAQADTKNIVFAGNAPGLYWGITEERAPPV